MMHTKQEQQGFADVGLTPKINVIDLCHPPLKESKKLNQVSAVQGDILNLPIKEQSLGLVTTHYTDSFIPGKVEFNKILKNRNNDAQAAHQETLELKIGMFSEIYRSIKTGGTFCLTIGTHDAPHRFNNKEEIELALKAAGFKDVIIEDTTDSLDYDSGKKELIPGNYFIAAFKE
jgi:SAM-dependent methyltransferase